MYNIDEVFHTLTAVLDENLERSHKDFWAIYFHMWRYLYCLNQNIEDSLTQKEKIALIETFIRQNKEVEEIEKALLEKNRVSKEKIEPADTILFPPHIQNIRELLAKEQARLAKFMKEVKREKSPLKEGKKITKKRVGKQKWLRS